MAEQWQVKGQPAALVRETLRTFRVLSRTGRGSLFSQPRNYVVSWSGRNGTVRHLFGKRNPGVARF